MVSSGKPLGLAMIALSKIIMTPKKISREFKRSVPGIITGAADNDPAGIATYSISGASFGFGQLWLMVLATPMLIAIQSMCARIGNVQRKGLSVILREHFSPVVAWLATLVLLVSNIFTIGADIVAMSAAFELITRIDLKFWILPITLLVWYLVLFKNYKVLSKFLLVMVLFFLAYIAAAFLAHPDWALVFKNLIWPIGAKFTRDYFIAAVAIMGTTITPYLFFWQVKEELEEHKTVQQGLREAAREDRINAPGFIFSQVITLFIIIATGATLHQQGISIASAADAARALAPVAGQGASILFALGIIGAGLLALPVLSASTAYVVAETAGWKHDSLSNKIHMAKGFYAVITLSLLAGVGVYIAGINPIKALYLSQVLAGSLAPFLLILIMIIANKRQVMADFLNGWFDNIFGSLAILVMLTATVLMFVG